MYQYFPPLGKDEQVESVAIENLVPFLFRIESQDFLVSERQDRLPGNRTFQEANFLVQTAKPAIAMLARREAETVLELLHRLDQAIGTAVKNNTTIEEVNPPRGFESSRP
jgi:hypothetical protein